MSDSNQQYDGFAVENGSLAGTIARYGTPVHTKPHGPDKTIVYYENPDYRPEADGENKDYAGTPTPAARTRVTTSPSRGAAMVSQVSSRTIVSGPGGRPGLGSNNVYANPNDEVRDVYVEGDTDPEIFKQEKKAVEFREKLSDRGTMAGEERPAANTRFTGGHTPFATSAGSPSLGAADLSSLDKRRTKDLQERMSAADESEVKRLLLESIPAFPAASDAGFSPANPKFEGLSLTAELQAISDEQTSSPLDEPEDEEKGGYGIGSNRQEEAPLEPETENVIFTPSPKLEEKIEGRTYGDLDMKTKEELLSLAEELGIEVARSDGKSGEVRKVDLIEALRTDK